MNHKILIIDDDKDLCALLQKSVGQKPLKQIIVIPVKKGCISFHRENTSLLFGGRSPN